MKYKAIFLTFISRFLILGLNFGLVIYSTNTWGSEGKGIISIITANLSIILLLGNIFSGSSVSYFASKFKKEQVLLYAYVWSIIVGITLPLFFRYHLPKMYTVYLIGLSVLSSLLATNINLFIGTKNIKMFNVYTILQLAVHILFIAGLVYIFKITGIEIYFIAQIGCLGILFTTSFFQLWKNLNLNISNFYFSKSIRSSLFNYGWKTQSSLFFHFLNSRLSYYFLEHFKGLSSVGIFSVGVACSEAIWTISKSLALVLYSDVVNQKNLDDTILQTKISLKMSFLMTLVCLIGILLIPASFYSWIFGKDFHQTKKIILFLSPGILLIAVSNILGYYFSGINKLKIINIKSIVGLAVSVFMSIFFIPKWGILGACIATSVSYCASSVLLLWSFYQSTKFCFQDFFISKSEIKLILQKIKKVK
jgi:O-antigen/teichoic acid export membrane protein